MDRQDLLYGHRPVLCHQRGGGGRGGGRGGYLKVLKIHASYVKGCNCEKSGSMVRSRQAGADIIRGVISLVAGRLYYHK